MVVVRIRRSSEEKTREFGCFMRSNTISLRCCVHMRLEVTRVVFVEANLKE